jgi:hypothetical protein
MAIDHVKSASITNSDASPVVANTMGEGAGAVLKNITGIATGVAASATDSTYQFVRVPSNCKIKSLIFQTATQAAGTMDFGLYFATDGQGGKPLSLLAANAIDQDFFAVAIVLTVITATDVTNNPVTSAYSPAKRNQPLWQAAGLLTDPGGSFDIVGTIGGTAITTGTGVMVLNCQYTD